jgi:hypothetical protein
MTTTLEQVLASNSWRKLISGEPYGESKQVELTVKAELIKLGGNSYAHYSITGTVKKLDKRYRDPYIMGGAIHDTIAQHYPELMPLITVHLSAPDGVPMHAEANAQYWAGLSTYADGSPMGEYKRAMLAQHLRITPAEADQARAAMIKGYPWQTILKVLKLSERWSDQAGSARSLLNSRVLANA